MTDATVSGSCRQHLGCWGDGLHRAISGGNRLPPTSRYNDPNTDLIGDCQKYALSHGFTVFAVQYQNECYTSADAESTYTKYGEVDNCKNGRGGFSALDVYNIETCITTGELSLHLTVQTQHNQCFIKLTVHFECD